LTRYIEYNNNDILRPDIYLYYDRELSIPAFPGYYASGGFVYEVEDRGFGAYVLNQNSCGVVPTTSTTTTTTTSTTTTTTTIPISKAVTVWYDRDRADVACHESGNLPSGDELTRYIAFNDNTLKQDIYLYYDNTLEIPAIDGYYASGTDAYYVAPGDSGYISSVVTCSLPTTTTSTTTTTTTLDYQEVKLRFSSGTSRACTNPTQSFYLPLGITMGLDTIVYRDETLLIPGINGYYASGSNLYELDNDGVIITEYTGWCSSTTTTSTSTTTTTGAGYNYYYTINFSNVGGNIQANLTFNSTNDPSNVSAATVNVIAVPLRYTSDGCSGINGAATSTTTTISSGATAGASNTANSEARGTTESVRLLGDGSLKFGTPGSEVTIMSNPGYVVIGGNNYYINGYNECREIASMP
jgi:hypothetical protein